MLEPLIGRGGGCWKFGVCVCGGGVSGLLLAVLKEGTKAKKLDSRIAVSFPSNLSLLSSERG